MRLISSSSLKPDSHSFHSPQQWLCVRVRKLVSGHSSSLSPVAVGYQRKNKRQIQYNRYLLHGREHLSVAIAEKLFMLPHGLILKLQTLGRDVIVWYVTLTLSDAEEPLAAESGAAESAAAESRSSISKYCSAVK